MLKKKVFVLVLLYAALAVMIGGCIGKTQPTRFYTLTPTLEDQGALRGSTASNELSIGIGPIKLADYLATLLASPAKLVATKGEEDKVIDEEASAADAQLDSELSETSSTEEGAGDVPSVDQLLKLVKAKLG